MPDSVIVIARRLEQIKVRVCHYDGKLTQAESRAFRVLIEAHIDGLEKEIAEVERLLGIP